MKGTGCHEGTGRLRFCTRPVPFMTRFLYGTGSVIEQTHNYVMCGTGSAD